MEHVHTCRNSKTSPHFRIWYDGKEIYVEQVEHELVNSEE